MNQQHFVVDVEEHEYDRREQQRDNHIRISYKTLVWIGGVVLVVVIAALGIFTSSLQMLWKAANYDRLQANMEHLRDRVHILEKDKQRSKDQISNLESLASQISVAYGVTPQTSDDLKPMDDDDNSSGALKESIQEFNILKAANFSHIFHHYAHQFQSHTQPSLWPVNGLLRSSFGKRSDPFSGEGAFHSGVDLSAALGTPVHATADGVVEFTGTSGRYGRLVIVDHGGGILTYYAHLSQLDVVTGQEVRRNEVIALSGGSGRVTGPHLHYEVRVHGTPVNPYKYLGLYGSKAPDMALSAQHHNDLGL